MAEVQETCTLPHDTPDPLVEGEVAAAFKSLPLRKLAGPDCTST